MEQKVIKNVCPTVMAEWGKMQSKMSAYMHQGFSLKTKTGLNLEA